MRTHLLGLTPQMGQAPHSFPGALLLAPWSPSTMLCGQRWPTLAAGHMTKTRICSTKGGALVCQEGPVVYRPSKGNPTPQTGWLSVRCEDPRPTPRDTDQPIPFLLSQLQTLPAALMLAVQKKKKKNQN